MLRYPSGMPVTVFPGVETHYRGSHFAVLDAGAHALAWTPPGRLPVLWVSPLETFQPDQPVRGGIPVVFPWFGAGDDGNRSPRHGYARTAIWQRTEVVDEIAAAGRLQVRHTLDESGLDSRPFRAELVTSFSADSLEISLEVTNSGSDEFSYEEALHTYLAVSEIDQVSLTGLDGHAYLDRVLGLENGDQQQTGEISFAGEVDRIYRHTGEVQVNDPGFNRTILVSKSGSADTVVWNPGKQVGSGVADIGPNWSGFVCVEAGNIGEHAIRLAPGERHRLIQQIRLG